MGNAQSSNRKLWWKLDIVIPESKPQNSWWEKDAKPFADDRDREQFICMPMPMPLAFVSSDGS